MNVKDYKGLKIGIALCGGGARGIAHAGILKALEEVGIAPDFISGTSMGSIVGAYYAEGLNPEEILDILSKPRFYKAFSFGVPYDGLTDLSYLKKILRDNIKDDTFEALQKNLFVCVSNLNSGEYEIFGGGKLSTTIMASCAIPLLFKPVKIHESVYADGGLLNNLPVEPLLERCDVIIGTNVNPNRPVDKVEGLINIGERCANLLIWENTKPRLNQCDIQLEVEGAFEFGTFDFKNAKQIYETGYTHTKTQIHQIQQVLDKKMRKKGLFKFW